MTLGKRRSTERFTDVHDDLKRSLTTGKESSSDVNLTLLQKIAS